MRPWQLIRSRGALENAMIEYERGCDEPRHNHRTEALRAFTRAVLIAPEEPILYQGPGTAPAGKGSAPG
jgi:hypothetical protein